MPKKYIVFLLWFVSSACFAGNALKEFSSLKNSGLLMLGKQGQSIISDHANTPFTPASTTKLITAWLALKHWGGNYHFKTQFYLDKTNHTLWVKGSGDPFLVSEELKVLAKNLRKQGLKRVDTIALDNSLFKSNMTLPGTGQTNNPYDAVPSALAANFNTIYIKKINGKVVSAESQTPLTAYARSFAKQIKSAPLRVNTGPNPVDAEQYFAELLAAFLSKEGVKVGKGVVRGRVSTQSLFYTHTNSKSLAEMIRAMMRYSTNFLANQLILVLSAEQYQRPANRADVQQYMHQTLKKVFRWSNFTIKDGAGLSRGNRLSPQQLAELLQAFRPWKNLLPEIETNIFAKSGTMNGISTLAGYIVDKKVWQAFAIMMNQPVPYKLRNHIALELAKLKVRNVHGITSRNY
ncbi:MAG: D-alanyl-D-alanine carboxypeptidase, partial [Methylococcales bacterium]